MLAGLWRGTARPKGKYFFIIGIILVCKDSCLAWWGLPSVHKSIPSDIQKHNSPQTQAEFPCGRKSYNMAKLYLISIAHRMWNAYCLLYGQTAEFFLEKIWGQLTENDGIRRYNQKFNSLRAYHKGGPARSFKTKWHPWRVSTCGKFKAYICRTQPVSA